MAGKKFPDTFKEGGFVGGEVFGGGVGRGVGCGRGFGESGGGGIDLVGDDKKAIARSAEWCAGDEREDGDVGGVDKGGDVGGFDDFFLFDGISITDGLIIDIDEVAIFEAFEARKDEFVLIIAVDIAGGMSCDN